MPSSFEQRWENLHHRLLRLAGKTEQDRLCLEREEKKKRRKTKLKKQRKARQTGCQQRVVHRALSSQYQKLCYHNRVISEMPPVLGCWQDTFTPQSIRISPDIPEKWACPENQPARCGVAA